MRILDASIQRENIQSGFRPILEARIYMISNRVAVSQKSLETSRATLDLAHPAKR